MKLFPAIDLRQGKVVRLLRGDFAQETAYSQDPAAQALAFVEAGASWIHVVDLDAARTGFPTQVEEVKRICTAVAGKAKVQVGGGVRVEREQGGTGASQYRDNGAIQVWLQAGAERVVVGTAALEHWDWFEGLIFRDAAMRGRLVLGLDARQGKLAIKGWEQQVALTPVDVAGRTRGSGLAAIVFTDISNDGTLGGPAAEEWFRLLAGATDVHLIASGGVGSVADLWKLREMGNRVPTLDGVIVGKALYSGAVTIGQAIEAVERSAG